ncbi:Nucleolar GTP-binding protein 1 [Ananas comosus]|uniref:Nucleolar GTP-binding protein 1 n=1 Tax=Ananas comosus TaxID=4615 RepID=A0A199UGI9_ANACO|nr:Nucleolar GTP-binding protein 1 [Ananas comosus]
MRASNLLHQLQIPPTNLAKRSIRRFSNSQIPKGRKSASETQKSHSLCICRQLQSSSCENAEEGTRRSNSEDVVFTLEKASKKHETVGAFQKLPMVMPAIDILSSAQRKARNELAVPLRTYMETFPNKRYLHPYERSLIELTFGEGNYEQVLGRVDALRKKLISVGKQHASLCAQSSSKREAEERLNEGRKRLEETFNIGKSAVDDLLTVAKTLRAMPVVDPRTPTLCLVGAPNVGKSSLVRILSSGKPEVCNYPFTTRGVLMGHIILNYERFQVTDTPGLLRRHEDDRNNIERLTLAVLSHLPTAVLFVHDLSGECGSSPDDQFVTYKEIKERFGDRLWLDVISKCDLLGDSSTGIIEGDDAVARYKMFGPDGSIRVSVKSELGVDELKSRVHQLLISQMARIRSEKGEEQSDGMISSS